MSLLHPHKRTIKVGENEIHAYGLPRIFWQDIYYYAMTCSWGVFFSTLALMFSLVNLMFAALYMLGDEAIGNLYPNNFLGAFFFSVETLATVGYGDMHPQSVYGHIISTLEIFMGMSGIALATGMIFSRFSRPRSSIVFAQNPVSHEVEGKRILMIRVANARLNVISEASAKLRLIQEENTTLYGKMRKLYDLKLEREEHPIFMLGWTLFHIIDESSPLFGLTPEQLSERKAALILSIQGVDETTNQNQNARQYYPCDLILWNHRYVDIFDHQASAQEIHYTRFHDAQEISAVIKE